MQRRAYIKGQWTEGMPAEHPCRNITVADEMKWSEMSECGEIGNEMCGRGKREQPWGKTSPVCVQYKTREVRDENCYSRVQLRRINAPHKFCMWHGEVPCLLSHAPTPYYVPWHSHPPSYREPQWGMGGSSGELSKELVTWKRKKGWRMICDVGEATEGL